MWRKECEQTAMTWVPEVVIHLSPKCPRTIFTTKSFPAEVLRKYCGSNFQPGMFLCKELVKIGLVPGTVQHVKLHMFLVKIHLPNSLNIWEWFQKVQQRLGALSSLVHSLFALSSLKWCTWEKSKEFPIALATMRETHTFHLSFWGLKMLHWKVHEFTT